MKKPTGQRVVSGYSSLRCSYHVSAVYNSLCSVSSSLPVFNLMPRRQWKYAWESLEHVDRGKPEAYSFMSAITLLPPRKRLSAV